MRFRRGHLRKGCPRERKQGDAAEGEVQQPRRRMTLPFKPGNCRAQMGRRIVPELDDPRVPLERGLHDAALHAAPAAVDQPHLAKTGAAAAST